MQAVGGVTPKVAGFDVTCQALGLSAEQGVLIPAPTSPTSWSAHSSSAVRLGGLHVSPVSGIAEGIELLAGHAALQRGEDGSYRRVRSTLS